MLTKLFSWYLKIPLIYKMGGAFVLGAALGLVMFFTMGPQSVETVSKYLAPFGAVFVNMLKMIVIPIVFFSLIVGSTSVALNKLGRVGIKAMGWYLATSLFATTFGIIIGQIVHPGRGVDIDWSRLAEAFGEQAASITAPSKGLVDVFTGMFANPFESLANGAFLPMVVFALLFGIATRVIADLGKERDKELAGFIITSANAINNSLYQIVGWVLEYAPIGVFALSVLNFGLYGTDLFGPYAKVIGGIVVGIILMVFLVYGGFILLFSRENPFRIFAGIKEAMLTAFVTRSSAATLPVSIRVATRGLGIRREVAGFTLPIGATINMDGVCIHLPMWAVLASDLFDIHPTFGMIVAMVVTTVLASIGAGGVPGGSLMLLFVILGIMGLDPQQIAIIIALSLSVNPILDMFETMNNVTGDIVCTYIVSKSEGMVDESRIETLT